jgi:hypothetical protein
LVFLLFKGKGELHIGKVLKILSGEAVPYNGMIALFKDLYNGKRNLNDIFNYRKKKGVSSFETPLKFRLAVFLRNP